MDGFIVFAGTVYLASVAISYGGMFFYDSVNDEPARRWDTRILDAILAFTPVLNTLIAVGCIGMMMALCRGQKWDD